MALASASLRLLVLLPLFAACAAPPPPEPAPAAPPAAPSGQPVGVLLHVEPPIAAPGAEVALVLANNTSGEIGFNLCMSSLERLSVHSWDPVPVAAVCTRELRIAAPGAEARYGKRLPPTLAPGVYRYVTNVEAPLNAAARHRRVEGEAFEVR